MIIKAKSLFSPVVLFTILFFLYAAYIILFLIQFDNPYAEESVLFIDSLRQPFTSALKRLDFGYPAAPIHLLWRLAYSLAKENVKITFYIVRSFSIFFVLYCLFRSFILLKSVTISSKSSSKYYFACASYSLLFIVSNPSCLFSFQLTYSSLPLIVSMIIVNIFYEDTSFNLVRSLFLKPSSNRGQFICKPILLDLIDLSIVFLCCLSKPLVWPLCLGYAFSLPMARHLSFNKQYARGYFNINVNVIRALICSLLIVSLLMIIFYHSPISHADNILNSSYKTKAFCYSYQDNHAAFLTCNLFKIVLRLGVIALSASSISIIVLLTFYITFPRSFIFESLDNKQSTLISKKKLYSSILYLLFPAFLVMAMLSGVGFFTPFSISLRDWSAIFPLMGFIFSCGNNKFLCTHFYSLNAVIRLKSIARSLPVKTVLIPFVLIAALVPGLKFFLVPNTSNYLKRNPTLDNISKFGSSCFYPGPSDWNGPYVLDDKYSCFVLPLLANNTTSFYAKDPNLIILKNKIMPDSLLLIRRLNANIYNNLLYKMKSLFLGFQTNKRNDLDLIHSSGNLLLGDASSCVNLDSNILKLVQQNFRLTDDFIQIPIRRERFSAYRYFQINIINYASGLCRKLSASPEYDLYLVFKTPASRVPYSSTMPLSYSTRVLRSLENVK